MEKRSLGENFDLEKIFNDSKHLCYHRLGNSAVRLEWDDKAKSIELFSDSALLLHLIINLIFNAIVAFENEPKTNLKSLKRRIWMSTAKIPDNNPTEAVIQVENNGPSIPTCIRSRIFEKGFTTHKGGHGQGLYICRLIAHYLGGELNLMPDKSLSAGMNAGFIVNVVIKIPRMQDLNSNLKS